MKRVAVVQSNYIPWKGYFDLIAAADEFILFDDMQYTRRDWRNRNKIKTPSGIQWLTVPVQVKGKYLQRIRDTLIGDPNWACTHWKTLACNYGNSRCFGEVSELLEPIYTGTGFTHLSQLNRTLIESICAYLGITTVISNSWDYTLGAGKSERLAELCAQAGGTEYISGPAARGYLDEAVFTRRGLSVSWFDYDGYPEYPQLWGEFSHQVSILDLLFNCGKEAAHYMRLGL
jgi:hypothetical protein